MWSLSLGSNGSGLQSPIAKCGLIAAASSAIRHGNAEQCGPLNSYSRAVTGARDPLTITIANTYFCAWGNQSGLPFAPR